MKILCLYHNPCALPLFDWLQKEGHETVLCSERLTEAWCEAQKFDLGISYTYRYIVSENILSVLKFNVVNLHNSYLPWNRGADPNLWSLVESTPRGVTLHYMEAELDKGAIIAQEIVPVLPGETLKTSYHALDIAAQSQFRRAFQLYSYWPQMKKYPLGKGSYHSVQDGIPLHQVINSYDMSVDEFRRCVQQGG